MASRARIGYGVKLRVGSIASGASGGYADIPGVLSVSPPTKSRPKINSTDADSANSVEQNIVGLVEIGDCTAELHFQPSDTVILALQGYIDSGVAYWFEVLYPNGRKINFTGYVGSLTEGIPVKDKMTGTLTIIPDGDNFSRAAS